MKQIVQSRPAVLYIVSESSWRMFESAFGTYIHRDPPLSEHPVDNDYTLLRETTDPAHPCYLDLDVTIDGTRYQSADAHRHHAALLLQPVLPAPVSSRPDESG